jgi:hypothetical protein
MTKLLKYTFLTAIHIGLASTFAFAGNEDRVGQAGSNELLINPFARSSGWAGANIASVKGIEAMFLNVAGTAFTKKSEFVFAHSRWLNSSDININAFGLTQAVGKDKTGTIGLGIMSVNYGDFNRTTYDQPDGGLGTFSPSSVNIGLSYAKEFSNSIYGGVVVKAVSQSIADITANGVAFDAGIQYVTGKKENLRFGISLRNIGPRMKFAGDGLSFRGSVPATGATLTVEQRAEAFEMPATLYIGAAYNVDINESQKLNFAANFQSNSFSKDNVQLGAEYQFFKMFMLRAGYAFELSSSNSAYQGIRTSAFTGPTAGFTFESPINKNNSTFGVDYSYRVTNPFGGVHSIGVRINL